MKSIKMNKTQITTLRNLLSILKGINNETQFSFKDNILTLRILDIANVMYYNIIINSEMFEIVEKGNNVEGQFSVDALDKYLKMFKDEAFLKFDNNIINVLSPTRKINLPIFEIESPCKEVKMTDDNFDTIINIESNDYNNMMMDIKLGLDQSNTITFDVKEDSFIMKCVNIEIKPESKLDIKKSIKTVFNSKYNYDYLKHTSIHKLFSTMTIKLKKDSPLMVECKGNGISMQLIIANLNDD